MQRKFLEDLNLDKDVIEKIMAEHGKAVTAEKNKAAEFETQLNSVKEQLKAFEGVDVSDLKNQITTLTNSLAEKEKQHKQEIADREFNDVLTSLVKEFKGKNAKAIMPFLDVETLKSSANRDADIKSALETVKKENGYLFEDTPQIVSETSGINTQAAGTNEKINSAFRGALGY